MDSSECIPLPFRGLTLLESCFTCRCTHTFFVSCIFACTCRKKPTRSKYLLAVISIRPLAHETLWTSQIARFMGPTWGPPEDDRTLVGHMLALWTLLSWMFHHVNIRSLISEVFMPLKLVMYRRQMGFRMQSHIGEVFGQICGILN